MSFTKYNKNGLQQLYDNILKGSPPITYKTGVLQLANLGIGAGQVVLIGGAPAVGKTAFAFQIIVDALINHPETKALYACCEMNSESLIIRQLARFSGVDATDIYKREYSVEIRQRLKVGFNILMDPILRIAFLDHPFSMENIKEAIEKIEPEILVIDYIQRFSMRNEASERRSEIIEIMSECRMLANSRIAVIVLSAISRQKNNYGKSGYSEPNLTSFRETSELEYGADQAFILDPLNDHLISQVQLLHLKNRHGGKNTLVLEFDKPRQSFKVHDSENSPSNGKINSKIPQRKTK